MVDDSIADDVDMLAQALNKMRVADSLGHSRLSVDTLPLNTFTVDYSENVEAVAAISNR